MSARLAILVLLVQTPFAFAGNITFDFTLDPSDVSVSEWNRFDVVTIPGGVIPFQQGDPSLPGIPYIFCIPQGTSVSSVTVEVEEISVLPDHYDIVPVNFDTYSSTAFPGISTISPIYSSGAFFPVQPVQIIHSGNRTGYRLGSFVLVPFCYQFLTGELSVITSAAVTINCSKDSGAGYVSITQRQNDTARNSLQNLVSNPDQLDAYAPDLRTSVDGDPVWIAIGPESMESTLQPLVEHRRNTLGESDYVTLEWIKDNYSGYDTPEIIRNYLIDQYTNHSLIFALMIGDYGETTRLSSLSYTNTSGTYYLDNVTDHYYIDLDGTWDEDRDRRYGESNDGMDYFSDICVGRFSSDVADDIEVMVEKTIHYETSTSMLSWQRSALLVGAVLRPPYTGALACDSVSNIIPSSWKIQKLYETQGGHPSTQVELINLGCSFVMTNAHGFPDRIVWYYDDKTIIGMSNYEKLLNIGMLSVFHCPSCLAGKLTERCLAECLMSHARGGAVASLFNSSVGWLQPPNLGPSEWLEIMFAKELFENGTYQIGLTQCNAKDALQAMGPEPLIGWVTQEHNLLGDPALKFITGQMGIEEGMPAHAEPIDLHVSGCNPAASSSAISYELSVGEVVDVQIYDICGRAVRTLYSGYLEAGSGSLGFDCCDDSGRTLPSGCYTVVVSSPNCFDSASLIIL
jgi:signal peptidase I